LLVWLFPRRGGVIDLSRPWLVDTEPAGTVGASRHIGADDADARTVQRSGEECRNLRASLVAFLW